MSTPEQSSSTAAPLTRRQLREIAEQRERAQADAEARARTSAPAQPAAPVARPHVAQPPAGQPPAAQPHVARPSAAQPPAVRQPARQAPADFEVPSLVEDRPAASPATRGGGVRPGEGTQAAAARAATLARPAAAPGQPDYTPLAHVRATASQQLPQRAPTPPSAAAVRGAPQHPGVAPARRSARPAAEAPVAPIARPAPAVAPPATTGAVRTVDETGRLTPVLPLGADGRVPTAAAAEPQRPGSPQPGASASRMGVRDAVAQARGTSAAPVNPSGGVTPAAAPPVGQQRASLASAPSAQSAWGPVDDGPVAFVPGGPGVPVSPYGGGAAPQGGQQGFVPGQSARRGAQAQAGQALAGQAQGAPAPVPSAQAPSSQELSSQAPSPQALPSQGLPSQTWPPASGTPAAAPGTWPGVAAPAAGQPAEALPSFDDVLGSDADAGPLVPAWGSVLGEGTAEHGTAPAAQAAEPTPTAERTTSDDAVFGLSWPQIIILVVIGLLLGVVVWLLVESGGTSSAGAAAVAEVTGRVVPGDVHTWWTSTLIR